MFSMLLLADEPKLSFTRFRDPVAFLVSAHAVLLVAKVGFAG